MIHVRYLAHIPISNVIVERVLVIKEGGHVGDERGTPIVNRPSPTLTNGAVSRVGRTTLADVRIDGGLEICLGG